MSSDMAIRVDALGKCYQIYNKPQDRLKQSLWRGRRKYYREFWALRDVSFEIRRGETVGIIGRNGSGKSTLLQLIAGTLTPTTGTVEVNGRVAALLELGSGFNPEFTGRENVYMNGAILGLTHREIDDRFEEIAAFAGIGEFIDQPVKTYSSGMMVRLAFAVSVCVDPEILIIDEALAVGDMAFQFKCMERLDRLTKSGVTLLFVSHDIGAVKAFCQRAVYLAKGAVRAAGSASDMVELYLMDMRDDQKCALTGQPVVGLKPALGSENALAFGTPQGRVQKVFFKDTGSERSVYSTGDVVKVQVEVEYDATVNHPAVSLILYDHRMVELAGRYFMISPGGAGKEGAGRAAVVLSFPAQLNNGNYYLTVRLEDRLGDNNLVPIDKQVGALSFQVIRPANLHFIGLVNMDMTCVAAEEAPLQQS